ncbi:hypothetical protein PENTCL1PPCAC_2964, partial [Pristionchus entomophagus]
FLLFFCVLLGLTNSLVDFTSSTLYDIYDFKEADEVPLPKCDYGCLIFASTKGEGFTQFPDGLDPYASQLFVTNHDDGMKISIAELAQKRDENQRKIPLTITGRGNISVINERAKVPWTDLVLYVIDNSRAAELSFEVYDPYYIQTTKIKPQSDILTFLSAFPIGISVDHSAQPNSVTARLVGFDNALDNNTDGCPYVYKTPESPSFPGFNFQAPAPILSFVADKMNAIEFGVDVVLYIERVRDFDMDGFITSSGWNGCAKPNNGGIQSFRTSVDMPEDKYILSSDDYVFDVTLTVLPDFDTSHRLTISDSKKLDHPIVIPGTTPEMFPQELSFTSANYLQIDYQNMAGDQGFLLRYSSKPFSVSYCNCGLRDGLLDNWDSSEIWVDLVVIVDTSAAMNAGRLEEAKSILTSFVALMSTDTSAEFYSRVGVIAASETFEVIYNLNMSSTDDGLDSIKQSTIDKIDIGAAFQAAIRMFEDGSKKPSYRENAKQIVYYLTHSPLKGNINSAVDFKTLGGIVIVNDFVLEGGIAYEGLKNLASDNFYFTDLSEKLSNLAVLCEANCFCDASNHPYNDDEKSPRTQANRGCFQPINNGIPQSKARQTCQMRGAELVSIHDQEKEFFVSSVVSIFGPKKKYWIGLEDDGESWHWDDKSSDPFSDWDANQPNTNEGKQLCAYATQTTGLNVGWTAANCAMGGILYVCE